ncbi:MAG: prolipoprotein diacylglyceryl transferase [Candidatus Acidiferrales bacterium]
MLPFLHIGSFMLPTYGMLAATGMLVGFFILRADLRRRGIEVDPASILGVAGIAGLAGARLYHLLESPSEFFAYPFHLLFSQTGLAWFGGFIGGFIALFFLARHYRMPFLLICDLCSPAAAMGYGIGRIGCLLSGDGDYGTPTSLPWGMSFPDGIVPTTERVHPTPIYEFLAALLIFYVLWKIGARFVKKPAESSSASSQEPAKTAPELSTVENTPAGSARVTAASSARALKKKAKRAKALESRPAPGASPYLPPPGSSFGIVFAYYLLLSGAERFLVEFIRINPRIFFGMSNAQAAALACLIAGASLLYSLKRRQPASA